MSPKQFYSYNGTIVPSTVVIFIASTLIPQPVLAIVVDVEDLSLDFNPSAVLVKLTPDALKQILDVGMPTFFHTELQLAGREIFTIEDLSELIVLPENKFLDYLAAVDVLADSIAEFRVGYLESIKKLMNDISGVPKC